MSMRASKGILGHPRLGRLDQFRRFLEEHALEPAGLGAERWLRMSSRQPAGSILAEGAHHMRWAWERNMTAVLHGEPLSLYPSILLSFYSSVPHSLFPSFSTFPLSIFSLTAPDRGERCDDDWCPLPLSTPPLLIRPSSIC